MDPLGSLRARAVGAALFPPTRLRDAVERMGFVQADPIRAPARAQDLILRHRVSGYRAGDLSRAFRRLGLEEDFLYAYGFMPARTRNLLHPRTGPDGAAFVPTDAEAAVLAHVRRAGRVHPRDLQAVFGPDRAVNAWGGFSAATTQLLERLHHHGLLRVAGRQNGVRLYQAAPDPAEAAPAAERARAAVLLVAATLQPVSPRSLNGALALLARRNPGLGRLAPVVASLLRDGALEHRAIDGEAYLSLPGAPVPAAVPRTVRLLAPFDPLVWDRRRFEHLWGWAYRLEAYTPPPRRQFGYYALPLLWGDRVIGWANLHVAGGALHAAFGFAGREPRGQPFRRALDAELERMRRFLLGPARAAPSPV